jgi:hypothetical protein
MKDILNKKPVTLSLLGAFMLAAGGAATYNEIYRDTNLVNFSAVYKAQEDGSLDITKAKCSGRDSGPRFARLEAAAGGYYDIKLYYNENSRAHLVSKREHQDRIVHEIREFCGGGDFDLPDVSFKIKNGKGSFTFK